VQKYTFWDNGKGIFYLAVSFWEMPAKQAYYDVKIYLFSHFAVWLMYENIKK